MINLIVARSMQTKAIGKENALLWKLPIDMKHFKDLTTGNVVIMGRKTWESIGSKPLSNRLNIIVSGSGYRTTETYTTSTLEEAIEAVKLLTSEKKDIFIIGGGKLYEYALERGLVQRIYLTEVDCDIDGDTYFDFDESEWSIVEEKTASKNEKNAYDCVFKVLESLNIK